MKTTRVTLISVVVGLAVCSTAFSDGQPTTRPARKTALERLSLRQLERFDQDRAALAAKLRDIEVPYPFVRGVFHAHSRLSHDSEGTITEIVAAAKATGTKIVGLTEHPSKTTDVIAANVKGPQDGVFFLAGSESNNEIYWPGQAGTADVRFVSHPEGVESFDRARYAGIEIYNTHSDAMDEPMGQLLVALVLNLPAAIRHPEAAFCALLDPPTEFLARFDQLTTEAPFAGLAANDSHQNQGIKLVALPDGSVEAVDVTGDTVWTGKGLAAGVLRAGFGQKGPVEARKVLASVQFDPYEISMRHVGTFLQVSEVNGKTIRHALRTGRICLGFEIIAPLPKVGFWVEQAGRPIGTVGDRVTWKKGLTLRCTLPLDADIRVIRNGRPIHAIHSNQFVLKDIQPGVYRMEAYQTLADERWPWVISNPIYVRAD